MLAIQSSALDFIVLKKVKGLVEMIERVRSDLYLSGGGTNPERHPMYATRLMTDIYHLLQPGGQQTLCGLRVSRVTSVRRTNTLQLVSELQPNLTICKHCERIQGQENNFAADYANERRT